MLFRSMTAVLGLAAIAASARAQCSNGPVTVFSAPPDGISSCTIIPVSDALGFKWDVAVTRSAAPQAVVYVLGQEGTRFGNVSVNPSQTETFLWIDGQNFQARPASVESATKIGDGSLRLAQMRISGNLGTGLPGQRALSVDDVLGMDIGGSVLGELFLANGDFESGLVHQNLSARVTLAGGTIVSLTVQGIIETPQHGPVPIACGGLAFLSTSSINANIDATFNSPIGVTSLLEAYDGPFRGSLRTGTIEKPHLGNGADFGLRIAGALDADITVLYNVLSPIVADSLAPGRTISIGISLFQSTEPFYAGRIRFASANSLGGQVIINAGADNPVHGSWVGPVLFGEDQNPLLTLSPVPHYTQTSNQIGGGSVGLVPYGLHQADCSPMNGTVANPAAVLVHTDLSVTGPTLRWYGPVQDASGRPASIQISMNGEWVSADKLFESTVNPAGDPYQARSVRFDPLENVPPVLGLYRIIRRPGGLSCAGTTATSAPDVDYFEYYFRLVPDCNGNGMVDPDEIGQQGASDCQSNGVLDCYEIFLAPYLDRDGLNGIDSCPPYYCSTDFDHDGHIRPADVALFVATWVQDLAQGTLNSDFDLNGVIQPADIALFISTWFAETGYCST